ncbi:MAG: hypothetical protein IPJ41_02455 [Phycisphaerales bacterium]|nr:hypothetical protein [Phycisphaerales bacterium]
MTSGASEQDGLADAEGESAEALETEGAVSRSEHARFTCKNCGAELRWDPDADALLCDHCGQSVAVPRLEGTILERPLSEAGAAARGLGVERRVVRCDTCGATVSLDSSATADICTYCGSPSVLVQDANRNAIRPESLIPLDVGRETAEAAFYRWISHLWFRPNALKRARQVGAMGVYLPAWTYDCRVHSEWSADAGYYYYVTETYTAMVNGKPEVRTRQVRHTRWVPAWGRRDDAFDDLLVHASRGLPAELLQSLGRFDLRGLCPYRPEYLAGWRAEEYQVDLASGWARAQETVVEVQRGRCSGDVPGDTQRALRVQNTISDARWKHVLLPIWVVQYRFAQRVYTVLIHGQTGRVVGRAPYSWVKIALTVAGVLAAAGLAALAAQASHSP